jgi:CMP/dCMP kinase
MVIAIDGPAGAGKSTVAKAVAAQLGFTYLDTGAMYRAVALTARAQHRPPQEIAREATIVVGDRVTVDGRDVTDAIRAPQVSEDASRVAADPDVRKALVKAQQSLLQQGDWVAEGRDIALVVAPDAEVKVFLTATPEVRARRRATQSGEDFETVLAGQAERDRRDREREHSPLAAAADAVPVDTSDLDLEAVLGQIETLVVEAREVTA